MITPAVRRLLGAITLAVCVGSVAPVLVVVAESFTATDYVVFPPIGLSVKWYVEFLKRPEFVDSLVVSTITAVAACVLATALGLGVAIVLFRGRFPGRAGLGALFMAPLSQPGIIHGLGLLQLLAREGIARNMFTLVLAHVVITTPFAIRFITVALAGVDRRMEQAAASLGAPPFSVFYRVTLPLLRPGLVAAAVFTLIVSFDEVGVSLFIASPQATTLPVRIFVFVAENYNPLVTAVSSLLILAALVGLVIIERFMGVGRLFGLK